MLGRGDRKIKVFIATSKKFYPEAKTLISRINSPNITVYHPYFDFDPKKVDNDLQMKIHVTLQHFLEIDQSDLLYALLPGGYIGYSVIIEITYAYAKGKLIWVSEPPCEYAVHAMVNEVCSPEDFVARIQEM